VIRSALRASGQRDRYGPAGMTTPVHGRRLLVVARDGQGRLLRVVLQPIDAADGTWRLRTVLVGGEGA